jgi:hypothetical protein
VVTAAATLRTMRRRWLGRVAKGALLAAAAALIVRALREVDWWAVAEAVRSYEVSSLAVALALAVPAYLACASYDLVGRRSTRHDIPLPRTMAISFVGYSFSLNLGAAIGGLAFRYSLYAPYLSPMATAQVIALTVLTNWLGYVTMAGALLAFAPPTALGETLPAPLLRTVGIALLSAAALYFGLCARRGGERVRWRGAPVELPRPRLAAGQLALSMLNWGSQGVLLTWLMPPEVTWLDVMGALFASAIAGILTHIPSGVGVLEGVFVALLGHRVPSSEIVAALVLFRVTYYIAPFALALVAYAGLEAARRTDRSAK